MSSLFQPNPFPEGDIQVVPPLDSDHESGYASGSSSDSSLPEISISNPWLKHLNRQLQGQTPQEILKWSYTTFPSLYQSTAFGLSGLVILDMLSKLNIPRPQLPDLIFLDTVHHFPETLKLLDRVRAQYPNVNIHVYRPAGVDTADEFAAKYGQKLWETDDQKYDWIAKVEPQSRAFRELSVNAVITGRRRSQGGKRGEMDVIEITEESIVKINPMANWSFDQVRDYIRANDVPYNVLLDNGYKSIGDWHSTQPVKDSEDERSGRWKGQQKTECGIHNPKSRYAQFLREQEQKRQAEAMQRALEEVALTQS